MLAFNWIPAGQTIWCYADNVRCLRDLQLRFDQAAIEAILGDEYGQLDVEEPLLMVYDTRVTRCAHVLADAFANRFEDDDLYGESITTALLVALHRAASGQSLALPSDGLRSWQLRITEEYLKENYASGISLPVLAKLVGLSQSRLARGFKASTGLAPYTWAIQARIRKATSLLANENMSLAAIALEVGFADQSHFTKAFKRSAGITPGEWRRSKK